MRRVALGLIASLGLIVAMSSGVAADISLTVVALSCSDNHSVIISVDLTTLTSLGADVQSINASGTNVPG